MAALDEAFAYLDSRQDYLVETLSRWCLQNSGSYHRAGLDAMADLVCEEYSELGLGPHRVPTPPFTTVTDQGRSQSHQTSDILRWDSGGEQARRILLMIHYDTVYEPGAQPAEPVVTPEGRMIGPGTADAKGGLLVMLESLRAIQMFQLADEVGWTAIANPDEEIGSLASTPWMREHAARFDFGLLFEPTLPDGQLVRARKGSGNFTVVVHGRSAHAGRNPQHGRNAVVKLCQILTEVDQIASRFEDITINVARCLGGDALNRVPDLSVGRFNVRVPDDDAQHAVQAEIQQCVRKHNETSGFQVELSGGFQSPAKPVTDAFESLQRLVEEAAHSVGRPIAWSDTGGACDGSKLFAAGLPNVDTLGPDGGQLHSPDEWVDLYSLIPAAKVLVSLIDKAQSQRIDGR